MRGVRRCPLGVESLPIEGRLTPSRWAECKGDGGFGPTIPVVVADEPSLAALFWLDVLHVDHQAVFAAPREERSTEAGAATGSNGASHHAATPRRRGLDLETEMTDNRCAGGGRDLRVARRHASVSVPPAAQPRLNLPRGAVDSVFASLLRRTPAPLCLA